MDLETTIKINEEILKLIERKYGSQFDDTWPRNTETTYYRRLVADTDKAKLALKPGGLCAAGKV